MKQLIYTFFFLAFIYSCKKENQIINSTNKYTYSFKVIDSLKLPIPNYASIELAAIFNFEKDTINRLYFLVVNSDKRYTEFVIYDLIKKKKIDEIQFPFEGENAYPLIHGITIKSTDSLYATNYYDTNVYLYNNESKLLKKYSYKYESETQVLEKLFSNTRLHKKIYYFNNKLHFSPRVYNTNANFDSRSLAFQLDLNTNKVINLNFYYPQKYFVSQTFTHTLSREFNGKQFIYAPQKSNNIWVTDINHKNTQIIEVKSKYFRQFISRKNLTVLLLVLLNMYLTLLMDL